MIGTTRQSGGGGREREVLSDSSRGSELDTRQMGVILQHDGGDKLARAALGSRATGGNTYTGEVLEKVRPSASVPRDLMSADSRSGGDTFYHGRYFSSSAMFLA